VPNTAIRKRCSTFDTPSAVSPAIVARCTTDGRIPNVHRKIIGPGLKFVGVIGEIPGEVGGRAVVPKENPVAVIAVLCRLQPQRPAVGVR
jgi:hypothetical protein